MSPKPRTPVARRRRSAARASLYASLLAGCLLLALIYAWMQPSFDFGMATSWNETDWTTYPEVQTLREYIRIDTSNPPEGNPLAGARWFAHQLTLLGLVPTVEEVGGEANVWAVLEGNSREAVVLHHHIDVDSIPDRGLWEYAPFAAEVDGPWVFGRGAFDMKSVAVAQLFAVRRLLESGRRPERSVILLGTTGEETGSDLGMRWLVREHPELVERFAVVLTEGGAVEGRSMDDLKYWGTEVVQKRLLDVILCGPRERLEGIPDALRSLGLTGGEPKLVPEVEAFMEAYGPTRDAADLEQMLSDPRALLRDRAAFDRLSRYQRSFFQNQILPHRLADRVGFAELRLRLLLLPGEDPRRVVDEMLPAWVRHGVSMEVVDAGAASHGSSPRHWAFEAIDEVMAEERPDVVHGPLFLPLTATDARFLRAAGVTTFGFSPFGVLTSEVMQLRKQGTANERMHLQGFVHGVELYADVLERLAG
jgi:acetylornithine deacetylase/succinyl-diaminopimelate desuccinylase-like protein